MTSPQYGFEIGPLMISFFSLIITVALIAGALLVRWLAQHSGESAEVVPDLLAWGLIGGVIGGRLAFILNPPPSVAIYYDRGWYLAHFFDLQIGPLAIWSGGLDMAGVLVGAALGVGAVLWWWRLDAWLWADLLSPGVLLMLAIGGWANIVNQQLFGPPTQLPWGLPLERRVPPFDDPLAYPATTRFHPTPAYLSLWALLTLGVLAIVQLRWQSRLQRGDIFLLMVAVYVPGLFLFDFLRVDLSRPLFGLSGVQIVATLIYVVVLPFAVRRLRRLLRLFVKISS